MAFHHLQTARLLIRTGRFPFLAAGFLLYLTGALYAIRTGTPFSLLSFLAGYLVCGSAHLSVSYSNDYFDRHTDDPDKRTAFSGGSGILVEHPGLAPAARACAVFLTLVSLTTTVLLIALWDYPPFILLFVGAGLFFGWAYSAPPLRFVDRGLGELSTMAAFGFFLPCSGYLFLAKGLDHSVLPLAIPLLFLGLFFIVSVELPDAGTDRRTGKQTLVVRFGPRAALAFGTTAAAFTTAGFLASALMGFRPVSFFIAATAASLVPFLTGISGIVLGAGDFRAAEAITGRNIAALIVFCLATVAALLLIVPG
jgi:1,4-dihydroxy-2-naphthoate octaprenyltransferase